MVFEAYIPNNYANNSVMLILHQINDKLVVEWFKNSYQI